MEIDRQASERRGESVGPAAAVELPWLSRAEAESVSEGLSLLQKKNHKLRTPASCEMAGAIRRAVQTRRASAERQS